VPHKIFSPRNVFGFGDVAKKKESEIQIKLGHSIKQAGPIRAVAGAVTGNQPSVPGDDWLAHGNLGFLIFAIMRVRSNTDYSLAS
jgi:hypothetical protein